MSKSEIELKPNQTIVFIGDSITDTDKELPAYQPFGYGYVHFAANLLLARYPHYNLNIINAGVSGDTIRLLSHRWDSDCIDHKPDVLTVLVGINDLWRQYVEQERLVEAVYPEEYELTYRLLLSRAAEQCNCQFVLAEPFMFCHDPANPMFKALSTYISIVHKLAKELDAVLVPLQSELDKQLQTVTPLRWSNDAVHPYVWAHAWIAQRWFDATGL